MTLTPCLVRTHRLGGGELIRLGHPLLDAYLDLVTARARPNTVLATAFDLKVFDTVIDKEPGEVVTADVLGFIKAQREPRHGGKVVRIEDGEQGLSAHLLQPAAEQRPRPPPSKHPRGTADRRPHLN